MKQFSFLWLLIVAMAMTSCQDEFIKNENKASDMIGYAVEANSISEPLKSRASRSSGTTDVAIEELDQTLGGKQLYLHTITDMVVPMDIKAEKDTQNPQSRGVIRDENLIDKIGVTSVVWNGTSWENSGTERKLYMDNVEAEAPNFQTNYYWPAAEQRIRFFAYHPADAVSIANSDDKSTQTIQWTVPRVVANQHDLLVASSDEPADKKAEAPLYFGHALTAVQFVIDAGVPGITINAARIWGVYNKGTYTYNYCGRNGNDGVGDTPDTDTGTWEIDETTGVVSEANCFEVTGLNVATGDGSAQTVVNTGSNVFMMMPHDVLPETAKIQIELTDVNGNPVTITGSIAGRSWQKGTLVKYLISLNSTSEEWKFEFVDQSGNVIAESPTNGGSFDWYGGIGNYRIRSYKKITDIVGRVTYEPAKWVVDEETMVSVDFVEKEEGSGATIPQGETDVKKFVPEGPYDYGVMPGTLTSAMHTNMSKESIVHRGTKDSPLDLSLYDNINGGWNEPVLNKTGRNTANCYIVRAPGYYKFPVVYGNAITDDVDNPAAYRLGKTNTTKQFTAKWHTCSTVSGSVTYDAGADKTFTAGILGAFYDHTGGEVNANTSVIKGPWIQDQGADYEPNSARLIWQDAPGLVSNVKLRKEPDGRYYISFRVSEETICEGNAVIAVCNDEIKTHPTDYPIDGIYDEPKVMWSWHIWVSNMNLAGIKEVTNRRVLGNYSDNDSESTNWTREESAFEVLPAQIGYCSADRKTYAASPGSVTFNQLDENGVVKNTYTLSFTRPSSFEVSETINAPVYQWGRKDPLLPFHYTYIDNKIVDKYYYTNSRLRKNTPLVSKYAGPKAISTSIQEPELFLLAADGVSTNINSRNWCDGNYINLWSANCDELPMFSYTHNLGVEEFHHNFDKLVDIPVVKTVYDPSPPGWEVPRIDAFSGVTFNGKVVRQFYDPNTVDNDKAYAFFSNKANVGSLIHLPSQMFEISIYRHPMPSLGVKIGGDFVPSESQPYNPELFWIQALGLRDDGKNYQYAEGGSCLTSSLVLIQWIGDKYTGGNGNSINYELNSSRFYFYTGGSLKPFSGSFPDKAFGIFPVKTGSNPKRTEVKTAGDINPWGSGGNIGIEF